MLEYHSKIFTIILNTERYSMQTLIRSLLLLFASSLVVNLLVCSAPKAGTKRMYTGESLQQYKVAYLVKGSPTYLKTPNNFKTQIQLLEIDDNSLGPEINYFDQYDLIEILPGKHTLKIGYKLAESYWHNNYSTYSNPLPEKRIFEAEAGKCYWIKSNMQVGIGMWNPTVLEESTDIYCPFSPTYRK
jgi:hypothetical protein